MPSPSFSFPFEAKCLVKEQYLSTCRRFAFLLRFYLSFESGTMCSSGNSSGLSYCYNHANKVAAFKLWAEPCQLQTAAARWSHQSTCSAPITLVLTPKPSRLSMSSGSRPWPLTYWCCFRKSLLPSSHSHAPSTTDQFLGWQRPLCRWGEYECPSGKSKQIQMWTQDVDQNPGSKSGA